MSYRSVTIEGPSYSGKSRFIEELALYGYASVDENAEYANGGLEFPPLPFRTIEEAKSSVDFCLRLERLRHQAAMELASESNLPIIMDRSPLSNMVFQIMLRDLESDSCSAYEYTVERILEAQKKGEIASPQVVIYLKPPSREEFLRRVNVRGETIFPIINGYESAEFMGGWYEKVLADHFGESNSRTIVGGTPSDNAKIILDFLPNANYTEPKLDKEKLLNY